jgi:hypothetical protein
MPISPLSSWADSYEEFFYSKISNPTTNPKVTKSLSVAEQPLLWAKWVHKNTQGIQAAPPWSTIPTVLEAAFPPVLIPSPGTAPTTAMIISSSWASYISSIVWTPAPPIPPFSVITSVVTSPAAIAAAQTSLLAALTAEFAKPMAPGEAGGKLKALGISSAFYSATLSLGVMIIGLSLPIPTPVPLVIPLSPIL